MQLQKMPAPGLCLPTSFAMALDIPVESLMSHYHDWRQVIFPGLPEPLCWRGVHIQEVIRTAYQYGYAITPHEMFPQIAPPRPGYDNHVVVYDSNEQVFADMVLLSRGVVTGVQGTPLIGLVGHAVAYDHGFIYDPNGYEYPYDLQACKSRQFYPQCAWRVDRIY